MRDLSLTYPSPSEANEYVHCPAAWVFKYRLGLKRPEKKLPMIGGLLVSDALDLWYQGKEGALEAYDRLSGEQWQAAGKFGDPQFESEWQEMVGSFRAPLKIFVERFQPVEPRWKGVVASQLRLKHPANMVPDLVVRDLNDELEVNEFKVVSGFAEVAMENATYEMDFQTVMYTIGVEHLFEEPCNKVRMRYLIRGKPASGKYKATPPDVDEHEFIVEPWKKQMVMSSLEMISVNMDCIDARLQGEEEVDLATIPRHMGKGHCVKLMGAKTFKCDYYPACEMNMHPGQVVGVYEQEKCDA